MWKVLLSALLALLPGFAVAQSITSGCSTTATAKARTSNAARLTTSANCFRKAQVTALAAKQVWRDRIAKSAPTSVGTPTSSPARSPAPPVVAPSEPTPTIAPTLDGVPAIPSNFDISSELTPSWPTGPEIGIGAFRFVCTPTHNAMVDPIQYPGQRNKGHLHTFFGNTAVDENSNFASLRTTGESSCNNKLNRSAYWIPSMMNGQGKVVMPNYVTIYYKRLPASDPGCAKMAAKGCIALPRGLRYIFGYTMIDGQMLGAAEILCDNPTATVNRDIPSAAKQCQLGQSLIVRLPGPNCWDGIHLDVPDHHSHMRYPSYGNWGYEKCPATHPYVLPFFQISAFYKVDASLDLTGKETWYLSSDRMSGMAQQKSGSTFHSDWFGAWDETILKTWTANCINKQLSCTGGALGNGQMLKQDTGYVWKTGTVLVDPPAPPLETSLVVPTR